ncbi:hypothetical protein RJ639_044298 [Escallonia herrerae]|uniref:Uncharacterized protein n=1 Tax=Escallonia herrerae TaxID=1293975 RepID=A0AA88WBT1_9ASTE|nr:hypothetical protein RJ639_044298 [Escallonia herrerae]
MVFYYSESSNFPRMTAIVLGTAIPLVLFLVWNAVILGTITGLEIVGSNKIVDPLEQLRSTNGAVGIFVAKSNSLSLATTFGTTVNQDTTSKYSRNVGVLKLPSGQSSPPPYLLTSIPPLVLSQLDPEIFFKALDFAGTYGMLVLFGILPAAMAWADRYSSSSQPSELPLLVPGGRLTLSLVIGGAGSVILSEIVENFGHQ